MSHGTEARCQSVNDGVDKPVAKDFMYVPLMLIAMCVAVQTKMAIALMLFSND